MNKSRSSQKKKQKSQDPKRLRDIRIPVEPKIPQCQVCEEKKADFYCTECKVHYCQNCESELHTSFLKKKHKEFIFQEPYDPRKEILGYLKSNTLLKERENKIKNNNHDFLTLKTLSFQTLQINNTNFKSK
ncbi:zinc finger protein [Anaeramoeba flamelloides]|uniref:Zinc finger protein n=1 Tax=Anaeramoeba flamelloides TaxID=1746091 RepID=A0ABQ8Z8G5_9EUKA|nr:zinc finger protein [Anaeramoeba flamelloides]